MNWRKSFPFFIFLIIAILSLWIIPKWQCLDLGKTSEEHFQLVNESRKTIAQILGGAFLLYGLILTLRRITITEKQLAVSIEGQITERFTRAIEQLGSDKLEIRLGGIYALERISQDSQKDYWPIIEVLTAYVREKSPWKEEQLTDKQLVLPSLVIHPHVEYNEPYLLLNRRFTPDIQSILTVLGRRSRTFMKGEDQQRLNLNGVDLRGANLKGANLEFVLLMGSHLEWADLTEANLRGAILFGSFLDNTDFSRANLEGCALVQVNLNGASLAQAQLKAANLADSNLTGANLDRANMDGAWLDKTCLKGANLMGALGLTEDQVRSAIIDENTKLPGYLNIKKT